MHGFSGAIVVKFTAFLERAKAMESPKLSTRKRVNINGLEKGIVFLKRGVEDLTFLT